MDELETKIVDLLNQARIGLANIRHIYESLEEALFDEGLANVEPDALQKLTQEQKDSILLNFDHLCSEDKAKIVRVLKGMILRLLAGNASDKILSAELGMSMLYSDVLHEDEELNETFLDTLSEDKSLLMSHVVDFLSLITKH